MDRWAWPRPPLHTEAYYTSRYYGHTRFGPMQLSPQHEAFLWQRWNSWSAKGFGGSLLIDELLLNQIKKQHWNPDLFFQGDLSTHRSPNVDDLYAGIPLDAERFCSVLPSTPTAPFVAQYFSWQSQKLLSVQRSRRKSTSAWTPTLETLDVVSLHPLHFYWLLYCLTALGFLSRTIWSVVKPRALLSPLAPIEALHYCVRWRRRDTARSQPVEVHASSAQVQRYRFSSQLLDFCDAPRVLVLRLMRSSYIVTVHIPGEGISQFLAIDLHV